MKATHCWDKLLSTQAESGTNNAYGITKREACIGSTTTILTFQLPSSGVVRSPASWRPAFCACALAAALAPATGLEKQRIPLRIALRFPTKRGSVDTVVNGFGDLEREKNMTLNVGKELAALAAADHQGVEGTLRRSVRRSDQRRQPRLARQTHRLALASAGRRRPVRTRPPPRRRTGQRRRPAAVAAEGQGGAGSRHAA